MNETALIGHAQAGDRSAFDALYALHHAAVVTRLSHLCGPGMQVDDLVQDTFIRAYRSLKRFRGDCPFAWWLLRIATHVARSQYRSLRRSLWRLFSGRDEEAALSDRGASSQPELTSVHAALRKLSPKLREAVVLHELEGRTLLEIAGEQEVSLHTIAARVRRGREQLRALLDDSELALSPCIEEVRR